MKLEIRTEIESAREDSAREDSVDEDEPKLVIKEEPQNDEVDANVSAASSCDYSLSQFKDDEPKFEDEEREPDQAQSSDEDIPLVSVNINIGIV